MVTDSFYPTVGGSETAIQNLSERFTDMGHEVIIYGVHPKIKSPPNNRVKVIKIESRVYGWNFKLFGKLANLNKEIKKFNPDIINAHFMLISGYLGVKVAKMNKIASLVTVRGKGVFYKPTNLLERFLFRLYRKTSLTADIMIATSDEMAEMVNKKWGRRPITLSNGVDIKLFHPGIKTDLRKKLSLDDKKIILCVRRLVPKNGIEYMIRAMPLILEKEKNTQLFLIARKISEYKKLKKLSEELNIINRVTFLGEIRHDVLPKYYAIADVVVQPSIAEARSLSCLETMASAKPIIATATGGLKELIQHGINGYLIPPFEKSTYQVGKINEKGVENLAKAVLEVLINRELKEKIEKEARRTAEENAWKNIVPRALQIYREAIKINKTKQ